MHWHHLESLTWRAHCTWLSATVHILIVLARTCDESSQGDACIEAQLMLPTMDCPTCVDWRRGLSAQIGALRPLLCTPEMESCLRIFNSVRAVTWHAWHGRRRRVGVDSEGRKWSFPKQVTPSHPAPYFTVRYQRIRKNVVCGEC